MAAERGGSGEAPVSQRVPPADDSVAPAEANGNDPVHVSSAGTVATLTAPAAAPPAEMPKELLFRRRVGLISAARELWGVRELIRTLTERSIRARYKQTFLGAGWAVVTPVLLMVVFSVFFRRVARVDTGGVPYALFAYLGLLPWTFFASAVSQGGVSLTQNNTLLNKMYCPREVFPLAAVVVAAIDMLIAYGVLILLFALNTFAPKVTSLWLPVLLAVQIAFTVGVTLVVSSVLVYVRDLRLAIPLILQVGLFATPVAYALSAIPESWRWPYCLLNPLGPVIDGFRRTVLYGQAPQWGYLGLAALTSVAVLVVGYLLFKRLEKGFADVA